MLPVWVVRRELFHLVKFMAATNSLHNLLRSFPALPKKESRVLFNQHIFRGTSLYRLYTGCTPPPSPLRISIIVFNYLPYCNQFIQSLLTGWNSLAHFSVPIIQILNLSYSFFFFWISFFMVCRFSFNKRSLHELRNQGKFFSTEFLFDWHLLKAALFPSFIAVLFLHFIFIYNSSPP